MRRINDFLRYHFAVCFIDSMEGSQQPVAKAADASRIGLNDEEVEQARQRRTGLIRYASSLAPVLSALPPSYIPRISDFLSLLAHLVLHRPGQIFVAAKHTGLTVTLLIAPNDEYDEHATTATAFLQRLQSIMRQISTDNADASIQDRLRGARGRSADVLRRTVFAHWRHNLAALLRSEQYAQFKANYADFITLAAAGSAPLSSERGHAMRYSMLLGELLGECDDLLSGRGSAAALNPAQQAALLGRFGAHIHTISTNIMERSDLGGAQAWLRRRGFKYRPFLKEVSFPGKAVERLVLLASRPGYAATLAKPLDLVILRGCIGRDDVLRYVREGANQRYYPEVVQFPKPLTEEEAEE